MISLQSTLRHQAVSGNQRLPVVYDSLNIKEITKRIKELQKLEARVKELEVQHKEMRRKFCTRQQELYDLPLESDTETPTIAGGKASWAEDDSLKTPVHSVRLAQWTRFIHGTPINDTLAALAAHFQVEDFSYLSVDDWPAVLEWFADLIIRY